MQNTAEKIEDLNPGGLSYFKRHMYKEAVEFWDSALQENALDYNQIQEIKEAKNWFLTIQVGKVKKEEIINQLNTLLGYYYIEFIGSFRDKDEKELTPVADILINEEGNILVIDEFNHRIQIYNNEKKEINSIGKKGKEAGQFYYPKALAQDSKGNLYVADCWNHRIQKFSPELEFLTAFGSYGNKEGEFNEPYDIAIDKKDRLFIVDRCNHRIQVYNSDGKFLYSFGQRGTVLEEELAEFYKTPKELFSIPAFEFPTKIALDTKENLYVVDSGNCRIQKLNLSGEFLSSFGEKGEEKDKFQNPFDIAIDKNDQIFISDTISNRIYQFTPQGLFVLSLKGDEENPAHVHLFHSPSAITFDKEERLVVAEDLSTEIRILNSFRKPTEDIYREKLLLSSDDSQIHCALGDFYNENKQWNEAAEEYAKALGRDKKNLDIKLKLARCLLKAEFSESHIDYDLIIDFSDQHTENLEKEILKLCEEKYQIELELLPKQWEQKWGVLVNRKDDQEIDLDFESKNRKINRSVREKLINYKKLSSKKKEYILLLFELLDRENFNNKREELNKKVIFLLKEDLNNILKYLEEKNHSAIISFLGIKIDTIKHVFDLIKDPDFKVDEENLAEYLINIYLSLNKNLLAFLRKREEIYSKVEKELNSFSASGVNFTAWSNIKESYRELVRLNPLIAFHRSRKDEILSLVKNRLLNEFKIFIQKSITSLFSIIEEIHWLSWEDTQFFARDESYIIDDYDEAIISVQNRLIERMSKEEKEKNDYLDHTVAVLGKIPLFSGKDYSAFDDFMNFIDRETESLMDISKAYEDQFINSIKEHVELEHENTNKRNLSGHEMIKLQDALERAKINKQLNQFYFCQSKKAIIMFWLRAMDIFKEYINNERSVEELIDLENRLNELWQRNVEHQKRFKDLIILNLKENPYKSNIFDFYRADLQFGNSVLVGFYEKITQFFVTLRSLLNQIISRKLFENSRELFEQKKYQESLNLSEKALKIYPSKVIIRPDRIKLTEDLIKKMENIHNKYFIEYDTSFGRHGIAHGEFHCPTYIIKDRDGNLLISDQFNNRVQKFTVDGQFISSFGIYGTSKVKLNNPVGLAVDNEGFIYVSNMSSHCIKKFSPEGDFVLSFGKYGSQEGEFNQPTCITIDSDQDIYVSDLSNHRIQKFSSQGEVLMSFSLKDIKGSESDIGYPVGIYIDKNKNILVGEVFNGQIHKLNSKGEYLSTFGKTGIREKEFNRVMGFAQDSEGNIYVSDFLNHRIQKFTNDFEFIWVFGTYGNGFGKFKGPFGIEIIDRYVFVCDFFNHRIQRFKISE